MRSRWWLVPLVLTLLLAAAWPTYASVLTSNNYTYLLRGQELNVPVDILIQRGAPVVPPELLNRFGLTLKEESGRILMERGPVTAELRLGDPTALIDGRSHALKTGPVRLSGRIFTPAEVLPHLGIQLEVDGKFVYLTDFGVGAPDQQPLPDFAHRLGSRTLRAPIRDGSNTGELEVIFLTRELLLDPALPVNWGARMQLLSLIPDRTLLMVTLRNHAVRSISLDPNRLPLIGASGRQYDYLRQEIAIDGQVTLPLAPGAVRTSVLVYPEVPETAVTLYYDPSGSMIGRLELR